MQLIRYNTHLTRLGERYRLIGILGSGGMADVCLAWDEQLDQEVALKIIKPQEMDQQTLNRFLKEATHIARLRHPAILRVYGETRFEVLNAQAGTMIPYIVMEYAPHGDLQKRLQPGQPYPLRETLHIFEQICHAVDFAHANGIIHRDIKPLNILFRALPDDREQAVLSDFGLSVEIDATHMSFAAAGTLPYMAPEQLRGQARTASDIFSLGVVLYQLLTGRLPFRHTLQQLVERAPLPIPTPPSILYPLLPTDLDDILALALAPDPGNRFPTALAFLDDVQHIFTANTVKRIVHYEKHSSSSSSHTRSEELASVIQPNTPKHPHTRSEELASVIQPNTPKHPYTRSERLASVIHPDTHSPQSFSISTPSPETKHTHKHTNNQHSIPHRANMQSSLSPHTDNQPSIPQRAGKKIHTSQYKNNQPSLSPHTNNPPTPRPTRNTPNTQSNPITPTPATPHDLPTTRPTTSRRWTRTLFLALALLIILTVTLFATPVFGHTLPTLLPAFFPPTATITLTPKTQTLADTYTLALVPGNPDTTKSELQLDTHKATSPTQTTTVKASGKTETPATVAEGELTFSNGAFKTQTVPAGTVLTTKSGVQVVTDTDAEMPPADSLNAKTSTATVKAHASKSGSIGNIQIKDFDQICCSTDNSIFVRNLTPFTGGKDAQNYAYVTQSDLDTTARPIIERLTSNPRADVDKKLKNGQVVSPTTCRPTLNYDRASLGDTGKNISTLNLSVAVTCSASSFSPDGATRLALDRLTREKGRALEDGGYKFIDQSMQKKMTLNARQGQNSTLEVHISGLWRYAIGDTLQTTLARQVAGKTVSQAQTFLQTQNYLDKVFISMNTAFNENTKLPEDVKRITILVKEP